jgi:small conductance mechanosensitive channel
VTRLSALVARWVLTWYDRRHTAPTGDLRAKIIQVKRRETTVAVIRTGIGYIAIAAALVAVAAQLTGGFDRLSAVAGASFFLIIVGFSAQRVLVDIIAGFNMFVERWYSVGDTIAIPMLEVQGVVEDVSLRRTKLRSLDGEVINIHNSQIAAVRVLPGGVKEFDVELVASNREAAELLIQDVGAVLPEGPTTFVRRPSIHAIDELSPGLVRLRVRAAVAPGREWLVHGFYPDLLKERAEKNLIVHGPVVLTVDEGATRSFARASAATRWAGVP